MHACERTSVDALCSDNKGVSFRVFRLGSLFQNTIPTATPVRSGGKTHRVYLSSKTFLFKGISVRAIMSNPQCTLDFICDL